MIMKTIWIVDLRWWRVGQILCCYSMQGLNAQVSESFMWGKGLTIVENVPFIKGGRIFIGDVLGMLGFMMVILLLRSQHELRITVWLILDDDDLITEIYPYVTVLLEHNTTCLVGSWAFVDWAWPRPKHKSYFVASSFIFNPWDSRGMSNNNPKFGKRVFGVW